MAGAKPVYSVDTCILLAWIQNEARKPDEMEGIAELARQVDANEIIMIASSIYRTEILPSRTSPDAMKKLDSLFKRSNVKSVPADTRITNLSSEIRDYYQQQHAIDGKPGLCTPDAIHLATAIHVKADAFYTFDRDGTKECRGLLPLNGNVAGFPLRVTIPPPPLQRPLEF